MQDKCKVDMNSYMASNVSYFHSHLDYFQNQPLGLRPNTNRKTMALRTLTTIGPFSFIMCEDLREYKFIKIAFG